MTLRDDLITRRDNIGTELTSVKNTDRHWQAYKSGLYHELEEIRKLLADPTIDLTASSGAVQPFEEETIGIS